MSKHFELTRDSIRSDFEPELLAVLRRIFRNAPEMDKLYRRDRHDISREAVANAKDQEPKLTMLTNYISSAMRRAKYEILADEGTFYGEIPGFDGIYADALSLEACRDELEEVLEEWVLFRVSRSLPLPVVDGIDLTIKKSSNASHRSDIGKELLVRILRQARIDKETWEAL